MSRGLRGEAALPFVAGTSAGASLHVKARIKKSVKRVILLGLF